MVPVNMEKWKKLMSFVNHVWIFETALASLIETLITFGALK
jgi:hypothetical protein